MKMIPVIMKNGLNYRMKYLFLQIWLFDHSFLLGKRKVLEIIHLSWSCYRFVRRRSRPWVLLIWSKFCSNFWNFSLFLIKGFFRDVRFGAEFQKTQHDFSYAGAKNMPYVGGLTGKPLTKKFATLLVWCLGAISLRATLERCKYFFKLLLYLTIKILRSWLLSCSEWFPGCSLLISFFDFRFCKSRQRWLRNFLTRPRAK